MRDVLGVCQVENVFDVLAQAGNDRVEFIGRLALGLKLFQRGRFADFPGVQLPESVEHVLDIFSRDLRECF